MASLVLGVVGNAIAPGIGGFIGSAVGSYIDSQLFGQDVQGPRIDDKRVQTSSYGADIPTCYGTIAVAGIIDWAPDLIEEEQEQGKGGPSATTFHHFANFACLLCEGEIDGVLRIWADDELIYDSRAANTGPISAQGVTIRVYPGSATQTADSLIQSYEGAANTPAYRHRAYLVFERMPVDRYGARIPNIRAEVAVTTGASPEVRVTGSVANGNMSFDRTRRILWSNGTNGRIQKIDALSLVLLDDRTTFSTSEDVPSGALGLDSRGYVYVNDGDLGALTVGYYKIDPVSLAVVGHIPRASGLPLSAKMVFGKVGATEYLVLTGSGTGVSAVLANSFEILGSKLTLSSETQEAVGVFDDTGNVWVLARNNTSTSIGLYRLEIDLPNATLSEEERIDMTANLGGSVASFTIRYFSAENALLIQNGSVVYKYDLDTRTVTGSLDLGANGLLFSSVIGGFIWARIATGQTIYKINPAAMAVDTTYAMNGYAGAGNISGAVYDEVLHAVWVDRSPTETIAQFLDRASGNGVALSTVVTNICAEVGLSAINVSALTDQTVRGYMRPRQMTARAVLEPLTLGYHFDGIESDYTLTFVKRGGASVATIADDDLGAHQYGQTRPPLLLETRTQDQELPVALTVNYINYSEEYAPGSQTIRRASESNSSKHEATVECPIVFTDDEAIRIGERTLYSAWAGRVGYSLALNYGFLRLDPADVVTITKSSVNHTARLEKVDFGANGVLQIEAKSEDVATYTAVSIGGEAAGADEKTIAYPAATELVPMDVPMLRDADDDAGFYVAAGPMSSSGTWAGSVIQRSASQNTGFSELASITTPATVGRTVNALSSVTQWGFFDDRHDLTVVLTSGELESVTKAQVYAGANAAYVGGEIISFLTATENADGSWTLSNIVRGRRGTEGEVGSHSVGEDFVLLTGQAGIGNVVDGTSLIDQPRYLRATTFGAVSDGASEAFTNTGARLKPWSPCQVAGERDGSSNLTITWRRRTRFGGQWRSGSTTVPLKEESESYSIDILDGDDVVRTLTATTPTVAYTAAQQTTDFGSAQAEVDVVVYQISATVGRGFPREATI